MTATTLTNKQQTTSSQEIRSSLLKIDVSELKGILPKPKKVITVE